MPGLAAGSGQLTKRDRSIGSSRLFISLFVSVRAPESRPFEYPWPKARSPGSSSGSALVIIILQERPLSRRGMRYTARLGIYRPLMPLRTRQMLSSSELLQTNEKVPYTSSWKARGSSQWLSYEFRERAASRCLGSREGHLLYR